MIDYVWLKKTCSIFCKSLRVARAINWPIQGKKECEESQSFTFSRYRGKIIRNEISDKTGVLPAFFSCMIWKCIFCHYRGQSTKMGGKHIPLPPPLKLGAGIFVSRVRTLRIVFLVSGLVSELKKTFKPFGQKMRMKNLLARWLLLAVADGTREGRRKPTRIMQAHVSGS